MSDEEESPDALDPKNALPVLVIQVSRVYDVLIALLRVQNPDLAKNMVAGHAEGKLFSPQPAFKFEEEEE